VIKTRWFLLYCRQKAKEPHRSAGGTNGEVPTAPRRIRPDARAPKRPEQSEELSQEDAAGPRGSAHGGGLLGEGGHELSAHLRLHIRLIRAVRGRGGGRG